MDKARKAAADGVIRAEQAGYSNLLLAGVLRAAGEDGRDRAFAAALFYGTLERQYTLDALLQAVLSRPLARLDKEVRSVLRTGLYQLRYMQVPAFAAVNEAVALCRAYKKTSAGALVNSVLRKAEKAPLPEHFPDEETRLSVLCSVHPSIAAMALRDYGDGAQGVLSAFFQRPPLSVRVNTLKTTPQALTALLAEEGVQARPGLVPGSLRLDGAGDPSALSAFAKGLFHVQGEASQAAVALLSPCPGQRVLDVCSAPGGKAVTMAQYMENKGSLFCGDDEEGRLPLTEGALSRCGVTIGTVECKDARVYDPALAGADAVLCDVPCTGIGTMHKKPDIRSKDISRLSELLALQRDILATAARYVRPGGRLLYSTCTINSLENEKQTAAFLAQNPEYGIIKTAPPLKGAKDTGAGWLLLPDATGTDGFFMALLGRMGV